jgi:hypothetical protein
VTRLIKRLAIAAIVILVVAAPINDIGKYLTASYDLDNISRKAAIQAAAVAKDQPQGSSAPGLAAQAYTRGKGVELYGFEVSDGQCTVWTRSAVAGTWVWGPYLAATARKPVSVWWSQSVPITATVSATIY